MVGFWRRLSFGLQSAHVMSSPGTERERLRLESSFRVPFIRRHIKSIAFVFQLDP